MRNRSFLIRIASIALAAMVALAGVSALAQAPAGQRGGGAPGGGGGGGRGGGGAAAGQQIRELRPGIYMVTGAGGNSTVRVTNEGIVVVDTKNTGETNYTSLVEQIRTVSNQPIRFAVITHVHQDHSGNGGLFMNAGAQAVAHRNLVTNLETYNPAQGKPATPNVTYEDDYIIRLGGAEVRVLHLGAGHTSGDSYVFFPDLRVIATGDAFANAINCDYAQGGSILQWARTLEEVLTLDFDMVVPGHGNDPLTKADVQAAQQRLSNISTAAVNAVRAGATRENFIDQINAADASLNVGALLQNNAARIDAFYAEARAAVGD